jgi:hypothetical protein
MDEGSTMPAAALEGQVLQGGPPAVSCKAGCGRYNTDKSLISLKDAPASSRFHSFILKTFRATSGCVSTLAFAIAIPAITKCVFPVPTARC